MILVIDAGNTRLKWGVRRRAADTEWRACGALDRDEIGQLGASLAAAHIDQPPERIVASNVAGEAAGEAISRALSHWATPIHWVRSAPAAHGLRNGYEIPERLGTDRWVALIGAWHRVCGACVVVNCGTATTVDVISADGEFRGGAILPGLALMKRSLAAHTAQLALLEGRHVDAPRNTADAIETGCLDAQAGAIERIHRRAAGDSPCLISGGAADRIAAILAIPAVSVPHLTLEGLAVMAG